MSVLEFGTMLEETFGHLGFCEFSYKLPNINGLSSVNRDVDVVKMCSKLDECRLIYVYAVTINVEETQDYRPSQQVNLEFLNLLNLDGYDND